MMSTHQTSAVRSQAPGEPGPDWRTRGACRDEDPDLMFPAGDHGPARAKTAHAKTVCRRCPVRADCLAWALEHGEDHGIWGGLTEGERQAVKQKTTTPATTPDEPEDERTRTVRQLAATGMSDPEIAAVIDRSTQTVQGIRRRAGIPPGLPQGRNRRAS